MSPVTLPDGYSDVPPGKLAAIVTSLQMTVRPPPRPETAEAPWALRLVERPDPDWYRDLFRHVGENWLWASRLEMTAPALLGVIHHPLVEVRALWAGDRPEGLLELDFREAGSCELTFFGLAGPLVGKGAGRWLMNRAIDLAWSRPIRRFWVHTCTLDHPAALAFYMRSGFVPFRRQVEVFDDPRLTGLLPAAAAPHVPLLG